MLLLDEIFASESTDALRLDEPPFALASNEAICVACRMAHIVAAGRNGLCPDCCD